jgi:hypothetical protein
MIDLKFKIIIYKIFNKKISYKNYFLICILLLILIKIFFCFLSKLDFKNINQKF